MAGERNVYGEIDNVTDLHEVFLDIRKDVDRANSRPALTELHRRAGYLITLSQAPTWEKKFGHDIAKIRSAAEDEFCRTARKINRHAEAIGTDANYDETWGR